MIHIKLKIETKDRSISVLNDASLPTSALTGTLPILVQDPKRFNLAYIHSQFGAGLKHLGRTTSNLHYQNRLDKDEK